MSDNFFFTQELEYPTSSSSSCESSESEDSLPDISSLKPYDFEPEIPYAEEEQTPESKQSILTSRIGNIHWCLCGECKPMETEAESLCCLDTNEVPDEYFEGEYFLHDIVCILKVIYKTIIYSVKNIYFKSYILLYRKEMCFKIRYISYGLHCKTSSEDSSFGVKPFEG